jgi:hypothetical protein
MTDLAFLGPWLRRFLLEHLVGERNLARNTQQSYRDTLRLLLLSPQSDSGGRLTGSRSRTSHPIRFGPSCANWKRSGAVVSRRGTSVWPRFIPLLFSSVSTARNKSSGAARSVPSRSKDHPSRSSTTSRKRRWIPCWQHRIRAELRVAEATLYCCSCTTAALARTRQPMSGSLISAWGRRRSVIPPRF